jgi:Tol biopolymer transport system component
MRVSLQAQVAAGLVVAFACFASVVPVAEASFPGRNGKIVYEWIGPSAYRAGPTATSVRTVDARSGRVRVLRDCPLLPPGYTECQVGGPRYSPDGRTIAFANTRMVVDYRRSWQYFPGLGTMGSDGSAFEEHITGKVYETLAWSPAGDRLLLQRDLAPAPDYRNRAAIFLASLDGTELSRVTPEGTSMPNWSSTGEIAFTGERNGTSCPPVCANIFVMRLGGTPRKLTYRGGASPSWSPHGKKLLFVRLELERARRGIDRADIYIIGRDGRGLRRLTRRGGSSPVWSPDGKWIAFLREGDIYVVRATGGGLRRLLNASPQTDGPLGEFAGTSLDWQPLPRH